MGERERAFRQRIARIARIQNLQEMQKQYGEQKTIMDSNKINNLNEISPVICGIKKNIENFRTKEAPEVEL